MTSDERVLIERAQAGDLAALEKLLERHMPALLRDVEPSLSASTKAFLSAEDVVQETLTDAF